VWGVRGNNWPNKKKFQNAISANWQVCRQTAASALFDAEPVSIEWLMVQEANPEKILQDEAIEQGW
jgi:hypothetical protein